MPVLTPDLLLRAYAAGLFPMAEDRRSPVIQWIDPARRGIIPLDGGFHVPRRLKRTVAQAPFRIEASTHFPQVIAACAEPVPGRERTWLNDELIDLYTRLWRMGFAHSVEAWAGESLVGGLYGLAIGGAFFGESMFNRATDASKVALVHLVERLRQGGFRLLDAQFVNDHLVQFGIVEIDRADYHRRLKAALRIGARFPLGKG
ncbi:MAG: leucyl/phenylalanyl-tRNA--protein transferase [Geminicoccaceae bacterium]|nr:leucyl/phenylalanyl-tRNA--protein transferase [Geminicoccaceae bacterium]